MCEYFNFILFNLINIKWLIITLLNEKLSNSKLNKFKSEIQNFTEVPLHFSSNMADDFNEGANFLHKLRLTNTQVIRLCKAFGNGL